MRRRSRPRCLAVPDDAIVITAAARPRGMVRDTPLDSPSEATGADAARAALDRAVESVTTIDAGLNATYRVDLAGGDRFVMKVATFAANEDALPEVRVLHRLDRDSPVPVPSVEAVSTAGDGPLDPVWYLMEYCDGRTDVHARTLAPDTHERVVAEAGRHLAGIHSLAVGERVGRLRAVDGGLRVTDPYENWRAEFREWWQIQVDRLRGEFVTADPDARFADCAPAVADAFAQFPADDAAPVLLHGDFRPANLVLAPPGDRPAVRAVIDVGTDVGDGLLDLALAETALADVPVADPGRAADLRTAFRDAYRDHRDVDAAAFERRYPFYRLYALAKYMGAFGYFEQFAPGSPDAVADRWRAALDERLAAVRAAGE
jgi:aminoglycoside phosphotransferase (APT) family kinase protein